jgi:LysM repeat protein
MGHYTVQSGDTLFSIADKLGITLSALQAANPGLNADDMQIGQVINTPGSEGGSVFQQYTVQAGDTFFSIAQKKGITVQALEQVNPSVDENNLQLGQVISIPQSGE